MTIYSFKVGRFVSGVWTITEHYTSSGNVPNDILDALSATTAERQNAYLKSGAGELESGFTRAIEPDDVLVLNPTVV